jgi:hypothetical protein
MGRFAYLSGVVLNLDLCFVGQRVMPYIKDGLICLSRIEDNASKSVSAVSFNILKKCFYQTLLQMHKFSLNPPASTGSKL